MGIKTGLRYENTRAYGLQLGNENVERSEFKRNYSDLFHNVFVSYNLDSAANHVLTVLTTRRLNRPYYLNLNPFVQYRDPYNYTMGNPLLNPQMQNRYEILYRFKGLLNMGLSYNLFTDVILPTTETIDNVFYTKHDNIAVGYMYLLNTTVNARFASWWNFIYTVRLSHIGLRGKVYVENLDYGINVARIELHNNFTISKKLSALVYSYYASKDLNGQMVSKAMFRTNLGLQWKILNEKATISLSFDDIFHSWQSRKYSTNITNAYVTSAGVGDTRRIGLSFSYRFDKGKNTRRGKTTRGTEEENGRI